MPLPAAALLVDFSIAAAARAAPAHVGEPSEEAAETIDAAYARGCEEGAAAAHAENEAALTEAHAASEARLAEMRAQWAAEEGARLAEEMRTAIAALGDSIRSAVGEVLGPFLEEAVRRRSVETLAQSLCDLLSSGEHETFSVSGPKDLLESLRLTLGDSAAAMTFEANEEIDVRVVADRTVIETQLGTWLPRLGENNEQRSNG